MAWGAVAAAVAPAVIGAITGGGKGGGSGGGGGSGSAALAEMARQQQRTADYAFIGDTSRPFMGDPEDPQKQLADRTLEALTRLNPEGDPESAIEEIAKQMALESTKDNQVGVQDEPMIAAKSPKVPEVIAAPSVEGTEYKVIEEEEEEEEKTLIPEEGSFLR